MFVNADYIWEVFHYLDEGEGEIEICGFLANKDLEDQVSSCWRKYDLQLNDKLITTDGELTPVVCGVAGRGDGDRLNCTYSEPYGSII